MNDHKIFKTAVRPALLMMIGVKNCTNNLFLSIIVGIVIYVIISRGQ